MKFLAVVLALVIIAEGIKVYTTDDSKDKFSFSLPKVKKPSIPDMGPFYKWSTC